jgi:hypothetical protein
MKRRQFIAGLGSTATWPLAALTGEHFFHVVAGAEA